MRKLVLDLTELSVEAFEVTATASGTVKGHGTSDTWCPTNCLSEPCFCPVDTWPNC